MKREILARILVLAGLLALLAIVGIARLSTRRGSLEVRARLAEDGGWTPSTFTVAAGQPLRLHLTSDDVVHGFAIGRNDTPAVEVYPGRFTEVTLTFDQPGTYTFYCTRWCGPNHWRMRGTIEVTGPGARPEAPEAPLFVQLGLDIDAPVWAAALPEQTPSAQRGAAFAERLPAAFLQRDFYLTNSPETAFRVLRGEASLNDLDDQSAWDLVAWLWQANITPQALAEGRRLYAANCAACHGETGQGDGVFAATPLPAGETMGATVFPPVDFSDPAHMLAVSPARLQGKILRGGMGSGMPAWGSIFHDEQAWALVGYLFTFQFTEVR